jgi:hypothetical protein
MEHIMNERKSLIDQAKKLRSQHDHIDLSKSTNAQIATFISKKKNETELHSLLEGFTSQDDRISKFKKEFEYQHSAFHQSSFLSLKSIYIDKLMFDSLISSIHTEDEVKEEKFDSILQVDSLFCCPVCQDEEKTIHLRLPCGHEFHWLCAIKSDNMTKKHECAVCRQKINLNIEGQEDVRKMNEAYMSMLGSVMGL